MDEEQILLELQKRNVNVNSLMLSSDNILQELKSRGFEETKDGSFLPTVEQQRKEQGAYGGIIDDMEIPEANTRSQAVEDYLTSPEFGRLALEITGGVVGAAFAPVIAPAVVIGRAAMMVRPALQAAVTRMAGAGIG